MGDLNKTPMITEEITSNDENGNNNAPPPSLLRIGLSAGFLSLAQSSGKCRNSNSNHNTSIHKSSCSFFNSNEDSATLALIKSAQTIASKKNMSGINKDSLDPITLTALSALGQFSHASNGVLVNVIDPSTPASGITFNKSSPTVLPNPSVPFSTTPTGPGTKTGGGLFKNLRNETGNAVWETSSHLPLHLFSKLQTIFNRDYSSTLHSVSYTNPRISTASNPSIGTIAHLPVRLGLAVQPISDPDRWHEGPYCHIYIAHCESIDHYRAKVRPAIQAFVNQIEGSGIGIRDDSNHGISTVARLGNESISIPSHPTSMGSPSISGSPSKKSTNKPSANEKALAKAGLQASKSYAAGNFGSRYIIVFVPTSGKSAINVKNANGAVFGSNTGGGSGGGFSGFRAGRKGATAGAGSFNEMDHRAPIDSDDASVTTFNSSLPTHDGKDGMLPSQDAHNEAAALPPGPISHSSKEVKELYHKFIKDFPNGRTVILGTLIDGSATDAAGEVALTVGDSAQISAMSPLKNQEWKSFLHNLGRVIVDGFGDRVKRYDEELRRLDAKRVAFVRRLSGERLPVLDDDASAFDLSHFFLVKESLAFTYEQMQLYDEAKLQYEELKAFLPEDTWRQLAHQADHNSESIVGDLSQELAMAGDSEGFRRCIKSSGRDLCGVLRLIPQYMFVREVRLLFQMGATVDALRLSKEFLIGEYKNRLLDVEFEFEKKWKLELELLDINCSSDIVLTKKNVLKREKCRKEAEVEAWTLSSSWDIKCASDHYFSFSESIEPPNEERKVVPVQLPSSSTDERDAARCLAELLEFAILRFIRLGDLAAGDRRGTDNPIRRVTTERPADTFQSWEPWRKLQQLRELKKPFLGINHSKSHSLESWEKDLLVHASSWLKKAFLNTITYEEAYLELADIAVRFNQLAGRLRFASRLEDHRAEVLICRGEFNEAAKLLSKNVGSRARDQWNTALYWRLFRLAFCQRMIGDVLPYLETLTQSFNPRLASVAPQKATLLFQKDLEAVISDAAVSEQRWGAFPFLETELLIESKTTRTSSQPLSFIRRKLTKHLSFVGDELTLTLKIHSHLPEAVCVNGICLYLVTLEKFEHIYRRDATVTEDDAFIILTLDSAISFEPGKNYFTFSWQPMTCDIYVLATVEIQWKEASFFYDSALLRKPIIGVDIQASEPTQTLELNPLFLIPGHVQNVRLVFQSGFDIITEGRATFICSDGLQVAPPKTESLSLDEAWSDECTILLHESEPGKKMVITTLVKSAPIKPGDDTDNVQTMKVRVETSYRHRSYNIVMAMGKEPESRPMKTVLEATVTTLDRPAFTVSDAEGFMFGEDQVMINITLLCNSPIPFHFKEWNLDLVPPLIVSNDGDLNHGMFRYAIPEGERLTLGFKCIRNDALFDPSCHTHEKPLLKVVLEDDFGKTFLQVLPFNLDILYNQLEKEDIRSELYTASVELICLNEEGTVGHPVPLMYKLNLQSIMIPKRKDTSRGESIAMEASCQVLFRILSEDSDWIISGKVQGLLDLSSQEDMITLHFRGIPTQSGVLHNFPELVLEFLPRKTTASKSIGVPPITVQCRNPEYFQAMAYNTSTSLAVSTGNEF